MPTALEQLTEVKTKVLAQIVDLETNPKPTYDVDGEAVDWQQHIDALYARLEKLNELIDREEGPSVEESFAIV